MKMKRWWKRAMALVLAAVLLAEIAIPAERRAVAATAKPGTEQDTYGQKLPSRPYFKTEKPETDKKTAEPSKPEPEPSRAEPPTGEKSAAPVKTESAKTEPAKTEPPVSASTPSAAPRAIGPLDTDCVLVPGGNAPDYHEKGKTDKVFLADTRPGSVILRKKSGAWKTEDLKGLKTHAEEFVCEEAFRNFVVTDVKAVAEEGAAECSEIELFMSEAISVKKDKKTKDEKPSEYTSGRITLPESVFHKKAVKISAPVFAPKLTYKDLKADGKDVKTVPAGAKTLTLTLVLNTELEGEGWFFIKPSGANIMWNKLSYLVFKDDLSKSGKKAGTEFEVTGEKNNEIKVSVTLDKNGKIEESGGTGTIAVPDVENILERWLEVEIPMEDRTEKNKIEKAGGTELNAEDRSGDEESESSLEVAQTIYDTAADLINKGLYDEWLLPGHNGLTVWGPISAMDERTTTREGFHSYGWADFGVQASIAAVGLFVELASGAWWETAGYSEDVRVDYIEELQQKVELLSDKTSAAFRALDRQNDYNMYKQQIADISRTLDGLNTKRQTVYVPTMEAIKKLLQKETISEKDDKAYERLLSVLYDPYETDSANFYELKHYGESLTGNPLYGTAEDVFSLYGKMSKSVSIFNSQDIEMRRQFADALLSEYAVNYLIMMSAISMQIESVNVKIKKREKELGIKSGAKSADRKLVELRAALYVAKTDQQALQEVYKKLENRYRVDEKSREKEEEMLKTSVYCYVTQKYYQKDIELADPLQVGDTTKMDMTGLDIVQPATNPDKRIFDHFDRLETSGMFELKFRSYGKSLKLKDLKKDSIVDIQNFEVKGIDVEKEKELAKLAAMDDLTSINQACLALGFSTSSLMKKSFNITKSKDVPTDAALSRNTRIMSGISQIEGGVQEKEERLNYKRYIKAFSESRQAEPKVLVLERMFEVCSQYPSQYTQPKRSEYKKITVQKNCPWEMLATECQDYEDMAEDSGMDSWVALLKYAEPAKLLEPEVVKPTETDAPREKVKLQVQSLRATTLKEGERTVTSIPEDARAIKGTFVIDGKEWSFKGEGTEQWNTSLVKITGGFGDINKNVKFTLSADARKLDFAITIPSKAESKGSRSLDDVQFSFDKNAFVDSKGAPADGGLIQSIPIDKVSVTLSAYEVDKTKKERNGYLNRKATFRLEGLEYVESAVSTGLSFDGAFRGAIVNEVKKGSSGNSVVVYFAVPAFREDGFGVGMVTLSGASLRLKRNKEIFMRDMPVAVADMLSAGNSIGGISVDTSSWEQLNKKALAQSLTTFGINMVGLVLNVFIPGFGSAIGVVGATVANVLFDTLWVDEPQLDPVIQKLGGLDNALNNLVQNTDQYMGESIEHAGANNIKKSLSDADRSVRNMNKRHNRQFDLVKYYLNKGSQTSDPVEYEVNKTLLAKTLSAVYEEETDSKAYLEDSYYGQLLEFGKEILGGGQRGDGLFEKYATLLGFWYNFNKQTINGRKSFNETLYQNYCQHYFLMEMALGNDISLRQEALKDDPNNVLDKKSLKVDEKKLAELTDQKARIYAEYLRQMNKVKTDENTNGKVRCYRDGNWYKTVITCRDPNDMADDSPKPSVLSNWKYENCSTLKARKKFQYKCDNSNIFTCSYTKVTPGGYYAKKKVRNVDGWKYNLYVSGAEDKVLKDSISASTLELMRDHAEKRGRSLYQDLKGLFSCKENPGFSNEYGIITKLERSLVTHYPKNPTNYFECTRTITAFDPKVGKNGSSGKAGEVKKYKVLYLRFDIEDYDYTLDRNVFRLNDLREKKLFVGTDRTSVDGWGKINDDPDNEFSMKQCLMLIEKA